MEPYILKPARVQYSEYVGTAAAETDFTTHSDDLDDVIGLDTNAWSILAIEFYDGTGVGQSSVTVYAIDREAHDLGPASHERLLDLAETRGDLPVTQFEVHGVRAEEITRRVFKRYRVQLRPAATADIDLRVEAQGDLQLDEG